ncbi:hypothetical protein BT96DRAFT_1005476 [Gymnopus androsaceus JB14]|uniref:Uncharacterized protein n=1 Tax=Gymnopus androsaceus JB14 TaxID=1447944 RepID=A0A6A4GNM1_9AGAR|nr:hypothetical protein BT96DRAFT_1005476 [Gymnopus androsaceus JB14]
MLIEKIHYKVSHPTNRYLPATLTETLVFLVCITGFDKPPTFTSSPLSNTRLFFAPSNPNLPPRPSYVLLGGGQEWVSVREAFWHYAIAASPEEADIVPVELVSVEYEAKTETLTESILSLTKLLPEYTNSCYRPLSLEPVCFTDEFSRPKAIHQTLAFSGIKDDFTAAFTELINPHPISNPKPRNRTLNPSEK